MSPRSSLSGYFLVLGVLFAAALVVAGSMLSGSRAAYAAPTCAEQVQAVKAQAAATGIIDQAKFQAAIACFEAQNGSQAPGSTPTTTTNPPAQATFWPEIVLGTYGLNLGTVVTCVQFFGDLTVTASTATQLPGPGFGPFVQDASGYWLGWPTIFAIFTLSGSSESFGFTSGASALVFSSSGLAFNVLGLNQVESCSALTSPV